MDLGSQNQNKSLPLNLPLREQGQTSESKYWSVSEISDRIRGTLEPAFSQVWVKGEVSNYRPASSGHLYFSLKDQGACISVASFGWGARKKTFELKDGLEILVRGKISVFKPKGSYQIVADHLEPLGTGALQLAFEKLKAQLAQEGLFDRALKRTLPRFPKRVAVITSPTGAVLQDIRNVLSRRAPHLQIEVIPTPVQGEGAAAQIIRALERAHQEALGDVIVLARGGGSIEDLWCFNDEGLARAIRQSRIPVISAVGHETDFTISDFVADERAPTPSAAAEILSSHWVQAQHTLIDLKKRFWASFKRELQVRQMNLNWVSARVLSPQDRLRERAQRVDELQMRMDQLFKLQHHQRKVLLNHLKDQLGHLSPGFQSQQKVEDLQHRLLYAFTREIHTRRSTFHFVSSRLVSPLDRLREQEKRALELQLRMERAFQGVLQQKRMRFERFIGQMDALSPLKVLERGYSLVRKPELDGSTQVIRSTSQVKSQDILEITFSDGKKQVQAL